jgi:outer membrane protein assembly factor BamB
VHYWLPYRNIHILQTDIQQDQLRSSVGGTVSYSQPNRGFLNMSSVRLKSRKRMLGLGAAALAVAIPAVLLTGSVSPAAADGTARHATAKHGAGTLSVPLSVDWKFTGGFFGSNPASPVITSDTAYIACGNAIYAISLETGGMKWRYPADPSAALPKLVVLTPTLANGTLYVSAPDGLYALSAADGKQLWRFNPAGKSQVITTPIVVGEHVYFIAQNGRMYDINATSGEMSDGPFKPANRPAGVDIGGDLAAEPTVNGNDVYYVTADQRIHAINLASGVVRYGVHFTADTSTAKPVFYGDGFYLGTGATFASYRSLNGQIRWSIPLPTDLAVPPAVDETGNAYIVLSDRTVYSINSRGKGLWKKPAKLDNRALTQPVVAGNLLIITTALGGVSAYDTSTGELRWNYKLSASSSNPASVPQGTSVAAQPVVVGDTLYALSDDGSLTAFRHDALDTTPPVIDRLDPELGEEINGRPPVRISAHLVDDGSGLDLSTITMSLDGVTLKRKSEDAVTTAMDNGFIYKVDTSTVEYTTIENETGKSATLADGHHTVTVTVKDWKGNEATKTWTFVTDDTIRKNSKSSSQGGVLGGKGGKGGGFGGGKGGGGGEPGGFGGAGGGN